jgi:phosphate transport system permease protein
METQRITRIPELPDLESLRPLVARKRALERAFLAIAIVGAVIIFGILLILLLGVALRGLPYLTPTFLTSPPSRFPEKAGVLPALVGSLWLIVLTGAISIPVGVLSAVYLEEYAPRNRIRRWLLLNISNMSGIPAIMYGVLGLVVFVKLMALGNSILAGSLTMSLLVLPIIVISTVEAIRLVPRSYREASLALGATKWQMVTRTVLPAAMPGIVSGILLALARALGEAAPLVTIGALAYVAHVPTSVFDPFTVLSIQIFGWASRPSSDFLGLAAAAIIVLLAIVFLLTIASVVIRTRAIRMRGGIR